MVGVQYCNQYDIVDARASIVREIQTVSRPVTPFF